MSDLQGGPLRQYYEAYWVPVENRGFEHVAPSRAGLALPRKVAQLVRHTIPPGARCLDVGCGAGHTAEVLTAHGCDYVGVDISETAVQQARARGLDARWIDDSGALPFAEASFDAVVCFEVLEHIFSPQLSVREMFRVLRPGGVVIATTPNVAYWRRRVDLGLLGRWNPFGYSLAVEQPWADPHIRFFNRGALDRLLASCGFTSITVGGHEGTLLGDLPWIGGRLRAAEASPLYRALEDRLPSAFGCFLHATAHKPPGERSSG
jgi:methionine biosynthesis protein MetW